MEKLAIAVLLISSILLVTPMTQTVTKSPEKVETWFQKLSHTKPKLTSSTSISTTYYKPRTQLQLEPKLGSDMMGQAHGFYASSSLEEVGLLHAMNLVFTKGKYRGSSLAVLGYNPTADLYREMPIVGGTGTKGFGEKEKKAMHTMEKLSQNGFEKVMREKKLDIMPGSGVRGTEPKLIQVAYAFEQASLVRISLPYHWD
ncbi:hypothetical protein LguiA_027626 [Lonicera macranthoides]